MPADDIPPGLGRLIIEAIDAIGHPTTVWTNVFEAGVDKPIEVGNTAGTRVMDLRPGRYRVDLHHAQHDQIDVEVVAGRESVVRSRSRARITMHTADALRENTTVWTVVSLVEPFSLEPASVGLVDSGNSNGTRVVDVLAGTYNVELRYLQPDFARVETLGSGLHEVWNRGRGRLVIEITDALGAPASVWTRILEQPDMHITSGQTSGTREFDLLPGVTYRAELGFEQPDLEQFTIEDGRRHLIRNRPRGRVVIETFDADEQPTQLWVVVDGEQGTITSGNCNGHREYDLLPGSYSVTLQHVQLDLIAFQITAGQSTRVRTNPRVRAIVETFDALGAPTSVWTQLYEEGSSRPLTSHNSGGRCAYDVLPDRPTRVSLGYLQPDSVALQPGGVVKNLPRGRLEILTVDANGAPYPTWTTIYSSGDLPKRITSGNTNAEGRLDVDLLPGRYIVATDDARGDWDVAVGAITRARIGRTQMPVETSAVEPEAVLSIEVVDVSITDGTARVSADARIGDDERTSVAFVLASTIPTDVQLNVRDLPGTDRPATAWSVEIEGGPIATNAHLRIPSTGLRGVLRAKGAVAQRVKMNVAPDGTLDYLWTEASACELSVRTESGAFASRQIEVVAGRPAMLALAAPESLLEPGAFVLPDGKPWSPGARVSIRDVMWDVPSFPTPRVSKATEPLPFTVRGHAELAPSPSNTEQSALLRPALPARGELASPMCLVALAGQVFDSAGNPIALDEWELVAEFAWEARGATTRPFVITDENPDQARDPEHAVWRVRPVERMPSVFAFQLAPASAPWISATTTLVLQAKRAGDAVVWRLELPCEPTTASQRFLHWLATGEPDGIAFVVADLLLSIVPFVGDGKDLLYYGMKRLRGYTLEPMDHVVASLALLGLILDLFPPAEAANVAAAAAKDAVKLLRTADATHAHKIASVMGEALEKSIPAIDKITDWNHLIEMAEFKRLVHTVEGLGDFASAVRRAHALGLLDRFVMAAGLMIGVIELGPLLFMVGRYTIEEVIDLLLGLHDMAEAM